MLIQIARNGARSCLQKSCLGLTAARFQSSASVVSKQCEGFEVESKDQVLWLKFNRPKKFNAITREMYTHMTETFEQINSDKSHKAIVLTGIGEYYSSGNDLSNFMIGMNHEQGPKAGMIECSAILKRFVNSLINLDKLLVAAVNGPAIGIAVSTLPLCDHVIASDKATFQTPFTALGQCPEACSSVTFPQIMGGSRASELLLLNKIWDAKKARNYGLVSDVVAHDKLDEHVDKLLYSKQGIVNGCYTHATKISKSLIRNKNAKQILTDANNKECEEILQLWLGEEFGDAVQKFFARSKK